MPTIYEKRTYSITVGKMAEVVNLYSTLGWPALEAGGFSKNLIGYFTSDTGELHQLVHLWRFNSDDDRRAFWKRLLADKDFMAFAGQLRPLIRTQANQLLLAAPWGPHP
ncbi:MAG: NIPSNAP family protein [Proteobacteria bacterium]|nr:NIPSNAP family protein [Pseudomonadota bacterium]MDA0981460.1 NIPSNAP family protein [Pseudomonadota bacterium]